MSDHTTTILQLFDRTVSESSRHFSINIQAPDTDRETSEDWFSLQNSTNGGVLISGNSSISVISGYYWYLKHYCHLHKSWCGERLDPPKSYPLLENPIKKSCPHRYRVYFNYCTFNYSASWWDWDRWEKEIDFMALNGINMPLSIVGLEGTWYYALIKSGLSDAEARDFLCGPAFLAWQFMTNIQSHAGPIPKSWIDERIQLGRRILTRQRELGMTPILHGFSGYVPKIFQDKYPNARIQQQRSWCGFEGVYQLDPLDPLFEEFGSLFLKTQIELFGTSHLFAADPFHEGSPPKNNPLYLRQVGKRIYSLMKKMDSKAKWVMQAWSLRASIVWAVPRNDLLICDLNSCRWKSTFKFWGYPFVAGILHNFGGRINLHGDLQKLSLNPFTKMVKTVKNNRGMGLFMEGITQNPVYYDLVFDLIWRDDAVDIIQWIREYFLRRYGSGGTQMDKIAQLLLQTAYRPGTDGVENSSIICARPALDVKKSGPNSGLLIPYDPHDLELLWQLLLANASSFSGSPGYRFDVVDIGRQVLSNFAQRYYQNIKKAWEDRDLTTFNHNASFFIALLSDVDNLLFTRNEYRFSTWVHDARAKGKNADEQLLFEYNAKMLLTLWGPEDSPLIFDYAWREWADLIQSFYIPRWQQFFDFLRENLKTVSEYSERGLKQVHGREEWRANHFYSKLADWETEWVKKPLNLKDRVAEDEITLATFLLNKYRPHF